MFKKIKFYQAKRANLKKLATKLQAAAEAQGMPNYQIAAAKVVAGGSMNHKLSIIEAIDLANNALSRDFRTAKFKLHWNDSSVIVNRR